ncbi:MAG: hypothetical protein QUV05_18805 [Phycisphaerae bacterium]|nr:hypothetical protein [Phycisphaerae bacterium]
MSKKKSRPDIPAPKPGSEPSVRRSARKWLLRVCLSLIALMVIGYATLPCWLPTGWLARRFEEQLSTSLNRKVHIGAIRVGWRQGVSIENVTIAERSGQQDELLARVGRIACGFTPLTTLRTGRVDRLEIIEPEIWLAFDDDGRLISLEDLGTRATGQSGFPTWEYRVRNAACHLRMPTLVQTFRIDDLTCQIDKPAGILAVSGQTVIHRDDPDLGPGETATASLLVDGKVITPKLRKDVALHGQARIEWEGLAVTDLPLLVAMHFPIEQLDGSTDGRLAFSVQPDLRIDYDLSITLRSVRILKRGTTRPAQVPDARFAGKGLWDPPTDRLALYEFDYETQAIHVRGAGNADQPALATDPAGDIPLTARLTGRVKDWVALGREFPDVAEWTRSAMVRIEGAADLSLDFVRRQDEDHLVADVEGRSIRFGLGPAAAEYLCGDSGIPKRLHVDASHNRQTGKYTQRQLSLSIGGTTLACRGEMVLPTTEVGDGWDWLAAVFPTLQYELAIRTEDLAEIARLRPAERRPSDLLQGHGPAEMAFSLTPQDGQSRLQLSVQIPAETAVDLGPRLMVKPAGQPLLLEAGLGIPHQFAGRLADPVLDVTYGRAGVHLSSDQARAEIRATREEGHPADGDETASAAAVLDATWKLPLSVQGVEALAGLFPDVITAIGEGSLRGDAALSIVGRFIDGAGDWLVRNELTLNARGLAARWQDVLDKSADEPVDLAFAHQCQSKAGRCEQSLYASLRQPAGEINGSLIFSEGRQEDCGDDFETVTVRAHIDDLGRFAAWSPPLREVLSRARASGSVRMECQSLLSDGRFNGLLSFDATGAGLTLGGSVPLVKKPETPAHLRLEWSTEECPGATADRQFRLVGGSVQMGGLAIEELSGFVAVDPGDPSFRLLEWARHAIGHERLSPRIKATALQMSGRIRADDPFWTEDPVLGEWCRKLKLTGEAGWRIETVLDADLFSLKGRLDAEHTGLSCDLSQRFAPTFSKPPGTPAEARFSLAAARSPGSQRVDLEAKDVEIDINGNTLKMGGLLQATVDPRGVWQPQKLDVDCSFQLTNPSAVREALPGCRFEMLEGVAFGRAVASGTPQQLDVSLIEAGFDRLLVGTGSEPFGLDGRVVLDQELLRLDQLAFSWGRSRGCIAGVIHAEDGERPRRARLGMVLEHFDQLELAALIRKLPLAPSTSSQPESEAAEVKRQIIELLQRLDLDLDLRVDQGTAVLPQDVQIEADAAVNRVAVKDGYVNMDFGAIVDGGTVAGSFTTDLKRTDPTFYLKYAANRVQPGPLVDRYLALTFPGMKATGPLTITDETYQKLLPAADEPNYEVGEGELMIEGGSVAGRAAPLWMTSIFPGLNFATFEFSYMHSWFKKYEDGRIRHQMIFQGRFYSVYMVGESNAEGYISYDVGIDFLADFDSRYWAESGQGRIPLFTKTGRMMPDGSLANEEVVYVPRKFIMSLLVKNNPVITAYHAVRKRVRGEQ